MLQRNFPPISARLLAQVKKGNLNPLDYGSLFRSCVRHGQMSVPELLQACYGYERGLARRMESIEQETPGITSKAELADAQTLLQAYRISEAELGELSYFPGAQRAAAVLRYHHLQNVIDQICDYRRGLLSHLPIKSGSGV